IFALGLMFIQAQPTYAKVLSVTAWSGAATSVVSTLVFCAALMVQDQQTLDSIDPTKGVNFVPTNLGAFLSSGASTVIRVIASSIDIFTIWFLILLSIGFAATSGARKITTSKTASLVFGLWIVWIVLRIGWNMLF
ncbi:MAG TPA: hypothetical protein VNN73_04405, partial [Blastocatellia bacterium]|nr:hypothetical protein [Blastocatellia bacterium]